MIKQSAIALISLLTLTHVYAQTVADDLQAVFDKIARKMTPAEEQEVIKYAQAVKQQDEQAHKGLVTQLHAVENKIDFLKTKAATQKLSTEEQKKLTKLETKQKALFYGCSAAMRLKFMEAQFEAKKNQ